MNKSQFTYTITTNVPTITSTEPTKTEALRTAADMLNDDQVNMIVIKKLPR